MLSFFGRGICSFVVFSFIINVMMDNNTAAGIGGAVLGLIVAFVWGLLDGEKPQDKGGHPEKEKPAPKPPRDWSPEIRIAKIIGGIILVIAILVFCIVAVIIANIVPTEPPSVWDQIKSEIGIPADTAQQTMREQLVVLVRASKKIPDWPVREEYVGKITDAARMMKRDEVIMLMSEARDKSNSFWINRANNLIKVDQWVIAIYIIVNILTQILAVFISWPLPGPFKSKITAGSILVLAIAAGIVFIAYNSDSRSGAVEGFEWGVMMGEISLVVSLLGVGITLFSRTIDPVNPRLKKLAGIGFGTIGAIIGSVTDTVWQSFILSDILVRQNGAITLQELVLMYLLGALFFRLIAGIFNPYTTAAQASTIETN